MTLYRLLVPQRVRGLLLMPVAMVRWRSRIDASVRQAFEIHFADARSTATGQR